MFNTITSQTKTTVILRERSGERSIFLAKQNSPAKQGSQ
ncbi:MAG: hypothetical protein GQF41_1768 [Candidatus Rifleibacterium amylolyticum]|nr:MAG: hypothetical protein GQF41_1768 [Candidatus Rifleibacterium amylolyticum]